MPHVVSAHLPLQAFVSSGMRTELELRARRICFEQISRSPFQGWLFEYTPAEVVTATQAYRSAVTSSDLIVWLVGSVTSQAVESELRLGLDLGKPFLVLGLPTGERDENTSSWVSRMRESFKTKDVENIDDLGVELESALNDFVAWAVRSAPRPTSFTDLRALDDRLRGIAVSRWLAVGVASTTAQELAADLVIGSLQQEASPRPDEPLRVLEAPVGAGKTLAAVRYLQRAILRVRTSQHSPYPVWVDARSGSDVEEAVESALSRAGRPQGSPVAVVVDGLDEAPPGIASLVLERARVIAFSGNENEVLLTSRPMGLPIRPAELASLPELTTDESVHLMQRAFGVEIDANQLIRLPESIRDSLQRPLFSLLLGRRLAQGREGALAVGDLIASLVTDALGGVELDALVANRDLALLAVASIDRGAAAVDPRTVGEGLDARALVGTHLVVDVGGKLSFSLPILREWFGGLAISSGVVPASALAADSERLERWRHAIFMSLATMPTSGADLLMRALAVEVPGFASEAMSSTAWSSETALQDAATLGARLHAAVQSLTEGLGRVGSLIAPSVGGKLPTLGIRSSDGALVYAWSNESTTPDVVLLPETFSIMSNQGDWGRRAYRGAVSGDPLWIWRIARNDLSTTLEAVLKNQVLFPDSAEARAEAAWIAALALQPIGEHFYGPLEAAHIRSRLADLGNSDVIPTRSRLIPLSPLKAVLEEAGDQLHPPYPGPDRERAGWIWSGFSASTLLVRTQMVYRAAIKIYEAYVGFFFPSLSSSLLLSLLLPARLEGVLRPVGDDLGIASSPALTYVFNPLPRDQTTQVEIRLAEPATHEADDNDLAWSWVERNAAAISMHRPHAPPWLGGSSHTTVLEVFGADPALRLAEGWLWDDLRHIRWVDHRGRD